MLFLERFFGDRFVVRLCLLDLMRVRHRHRHRHRHPADLWREERARELERHDAIFTA